MFLDHRNSVPILISCVYFVVVLGQLKNISRRIFFIKPRAAQNIQQSIIVQQTAVIQEYSTTEIIIGMSTEGGKGYAVFELIKNIALYSASSFL